MSKRFGESVEVCKFLTRDHLQERFAGDVSLGPSSSGSGERFMRYKRPVTEAFEDALDGRLRGLVEGRKDVAVAKSNEVESPWSKGSDKLR